MPGETRLLSERVAALSEDLECSIEALDRICAAIDVKRETPAPTPTPQDTSPVVGDASDLAEALTILVGRLDALCERLERRVDRLERFADSVDGRIDERSPPPGRETTESTGPSPSEEAGAPASVPGELGAIREQVEALVGGLRQADSDGEPAVELQVIRGLRERLADFLQKLEEEEKQ